MTSDECRLNCSATGGKMITKRWTCLRCFEENLNDSFRFLNDHLVHKVENFLKINNAIYLNKTNGSKDSKNGKESPRQGFPGTNPSWLRTSLLLKYLTESQLSQLFADINGHNVTEVDFHVNASFDYMNETGLWDDGEKIDAEWWFRKSENDNETMIPLFDQVKTITSSPWRHLWVEMSLNEWFYSHLLKTNWHGQYIHTWNIIRE